MKAPSLCLIPLALFPSLAVANKPNILFIYTDDHSYRTLSCYQHAASWARTPNIDRLAKRGVQFTHSYIGTWCMPPLRRCGWRENIPAGPKDEPVLGDVAHAETE